MGWETDPEFRRGTGCAGARRGQEIQFADLVWRGLALITPEDVRGRAVDPLTLDTRSQPALIPCGAFR